MALHKYHAKVIYGGRATGKTYAVAKWAFEKSHDLSGFRTIFYVGHRGSWDTFVKYSEEMYEVKYSRALGQISYPNGVKVRFFNVYGDPNHFRGNIASAVIFENVDSWPQDFNYEILNFSTRLVDGWDTVVTSLNGSYPEGLGLRSVTYHGKTSP